MSEPPKAVSVRVKPASRHNHVGGRYHGPDGDALRVDVQAAASEGAATEAAPRALAQALEIPAARVRLRRGRTTRNKVFLISPAPPDLEARIERLKQDDQ